MKTSDPKAIDKEKIKNIVFDWGGVLIEIDYYATIEAFNKLGFEDFKAFYSQKNQMEFFIGFEIGKHSPDQFRNYIRDVLKQDLPDKIINDAWCAMLLDIPKSRIEVINKLKAKYKLYLLSNTNQLHEDLVLPRINSSLKLDFFSLFDGVYLSHRIGMRKPHIDIYKYVLNDKGMKAEETLFIDDTEVNIDASASIGIKSFYLNSGLDIVQLFRDW